jgi:hypothetical protein
MLAELLTDFKTDAARAAKKLIAFGESKPDATLDPTTLAGMGTQC